MAVTYEMTFTTNQHIFVFMITKLLVAAALSDDHGRMFERLAVYTHVCAQSIDTRAECPASCAGAGCTSWNIIA